MTDTKLSDFTVEQIDPMLNCLDGRLNDLELTLMRTELWDESQVRDAIIASANKEADILMLWKVQLLNAKEVVNNREKVNNS